MRDFLISDDNYQLFAAKAYQKTVCLSTEEFLIDLKAVERLKSDITRWGNDREDTQLRLIINKIIMFSNMFGLEETLKMLFWKNRRDEYTTNFLMTMTVFLGIMPETPLPISAGLILDSTKFNTNSELLESLENIFNDTNR